MARKRNHISVTSFSGMPRGRPQACNEVGCSLSFERTYHATINPPRTAAGHVVYFDEHIERLRALYQRNTRRA